MTATAASGYSFSNWTEGGTVVSWSANYGFTVTGNRTLTANFTSTPPPSYTITTASNPSSGGSTSGGGSVEFPILASGSVISVALQDEASGLTTTALDEVAPAFSAVFSGVEPGRSYRLAVVAQGKADEGKFVHRSTFERRLDPPTDLQEGSGFSVVSSDLVGTPVERIVAPAADGPISFKLWSAIRGVVETCEGVPGGEAVEFAIPDWNCWHWVGGWREAAGELVLSLWLRHELEE